MMSSSAPHAQNSAASVMSIDDQRGGDESDLAAEQAEAGIDVAGEDLEETIDDAGAAHRRALACPRLQHRTAALWQPTLVLARPDAGTPIVRRVWTSAT